MSKITYIDLETSGLNRFYDQILTAFAKTVDETSSTVDILNESCSMTGFRLPHPEALLVNDINLNSLSQNQSLKSLSHKLYDYITRQGPSIIIAHNANFDYSMASNAFYQNLVTSDFYQWKCHGNVLVDSLALTKAVFAFDSGKNFKVKETEAGFPRFDLPSLCEANKIEINPHEAKEDVLALEKIVNLMIKESPHLFKLALKSSSRKEAQNLVNGEAFFLVALGSYSNFNSRVLAPVYINEAGTDAVCVDLLGDLSEIENLSPLQMTSFFGSRITKKQPIIRLPLNKGHVLVSSSFVNKNKQALKVGSKELFRRASQIRRNKDLKNIASEAMGWRHEEFEEIEPTVEELIYAAGFPSNMEKSFVTAFNLADPEDRPALTKAYSERFSCDRFIRMAYRVMLEDFPSCNSHLEQEAYFDWCQKRLFSSPSEDCIPEWNTIYSCLSEIEKLKQKYPNRLEKIEELRLFYHRLAHFSGLEFPKTFGH